jgi:hypothetical protein
MDLKTISTYELLQRFPVEESVPYVKSAMGGYIMALRSAAKDRHLFRHAMGLSSLALCGYGRAGKDEAAKYLIQAYGYGYSGSASRLALPLIAVAIDQPAVDVWSSRHLHRKYWFEWLNEFRRDDPSLLARMCLGVSDLVVGIRDHRELADAKAKKLCDKFIWIDRPGVPVDPTLTYTKEDCETVIVNPGDIRNPDPGDLENYHCVLDHYCGTIGLLRLPM